MKKIILPALFSIALCGCYAASENSTEPSHLSSSNIAESSLVETSSSSASLSSFVRDSGIGSSVASSNIEVNSNDTVVINPTAPSSITDLTLTGISYDAAKKTFNIISAGEFVFQGEFEGNILVNAGELDEVKITLNGFKIKSTTDSPIKCLKAAEFQVSAKKGTVNYVYDSRPLKVEDDETVGSGAIHSDTDLKISGKGSLFVFATYNNGIHSKDDLKIKPEAFEGSKLQVKSVNNSLRGNDSVTIESGDIVLISESGNGIITKSTDISSKGKQRGTVTINGGHVDIYSAKDAIDAAYNIEVTPLEGGEAPTVNIYTSKFSSYTGDVSSEEKSNKTMYLRASSNANNAYYAVEFMLADYSTTWKKATYVSGSSRNGYYFKLDVPVSATSMKVCLFPNSVTDMNEANATAKMSSFQTINAYYDTARISTSGSSISLSGWTNYQTQAGPGGGMQEGNSDKADYSAKGFKAANEIKISDGHFFMKCFDDAIHANHGDTLENGSIGLGNVLVSGGTFEIYATDDALHADDTISIVGGTINIVYSYEGIEGNIVNVSGGYTKIYSVDDGVNCANKAGKNPSINVSGGILDVTVYGQDVDGIDSNGSFTQTGGNIITKGGTGGMSTGLDVDGTATISGGTFVCFGSPEKRPSLSNGVSSYTLSASYAIGTYEITLPDSQKVTTTNKYSYSAIYVYSDSPTRITVAKI